MHRARSRKPCELAEAVPGEGARLGGKLPPTDMIVKPDRVHRRDGRGWDAHFSPSYKDAESPRILG